MRFIDKGNKVQIQIAYTHFRRSEIVADFTIPKADFQNFCEHVEKSIKEAYKRDDLFPSIRVFHNLPVVEEEE